MKWNKEYNNNEINKYINGLMVVLSVYSASPYEVSGKLQSLFLFAVLLFMSL